MNIFLRLALGIIIGGGAGFGYYKLVGCSTGVCPITSNPLITIIYGAVIGILIALL